MLCLKNGFNLFEHDGARPGQKLNRGEISQICRSQNAQILADGVKARLLSFAWLHPNVNCYDISHLGRGGAKEDENIDFVEQGCVQLAADLGEKG